MLRTINRDYMKINIETPVDTKTSFTSLTKAIKLHFLTENSKRQTNRQDLEIDVHFLNPKDMIELNTQYRDKDYLTDVLSFSYLENLMDHETLAGEIFVSMEKAQSQALEKGNDLETELYYLITHGYLHITGHLHDSDDQEAEMNDAEDWILKTSINKTINR